MLMLRDVVTVAAEAGHEEHPLAVAGYRLLEDALGHDSAAAREVVRHPSVGAWAARTILACRGVLRTPGASPAGLRAIGAVAAIRADLTSEIEVGAARGLLMLPSLGAARIAGRTAVLRVARGQARVGPVEVPGDPHQDAPCWFGLRRVRHEEFDVLIDDLDPFRMPAACDLAPHSSGNAWASALRQAWAVLADVHPDVAAEVAAAVSVIVPRTAPPAGSVSSSAPECFGSVAMSLPADPVSGAETFAHEVQHVKLGAMLLHVPLVLDDDGSLYYAPWRPDPRPLGGLLQGTYAYLGVSGFWRRQQHEPGYQEVGATKYARWRDATALAVEILLTSGRLTSEGMDFVAGMARTLDAWKREPVPKPALAIARRAAREHLSRWELDHGPHRDDHPGQSLLPVGARLL
jgi:HEXXH motif-containing protein